MAHSLEARQPFLDYRLVEFAAALPSSLKYRSGRGKRPALRCVFRLDSGIDLEAFEDGFWNPGGKLVSRTVAF